MVEIHIMNQGTAKKQVETGDGSLMWISHSNRRSHDDELYHALGVEGGGMDLNIENIASIEILLACSLVLVIVERSSSTVRLSGHI